MSSILVPVDGSESARSALRLAIHMLRERGQERLVLLNVQPPIESGLVRAHFSAAAIEAGLLGWGEDVLRPYREYLDRAGIAYSAKVEIGHFGATIASAPERLGCDEIVMGSRGAGPLVSLVVGSVATQVAQSAKVPVTIVKTGEDAAAFFGAVLVAVDGSRHANGAVQYVIDHQPKDRATHVRLLHVRELFAAVPESGQADTTELGRVATSEEATREPRHLLEEAGIPYLVDIRFGHPGTAIAHVAQADGCGRIVMGTRGLGTMQSLLLGSVAYKTLHSAAVPVTLVK